MDVDKSEQTNSFNSRMKILMGIPAPGLKGGPPTHLPYLVEYFQKNEEFVIKTFYYGSKKNVRESFFQKIFNTSKVILQFIKLVVSFKPDVIHLNSAFDKLSVIRDVPFSILCRLFSKPVLFKIHGSHYDLLLTNNRFLKILIRLFFWGCTKVGVLSEVEKNEFIRSYGNSDKLVVVKNIVPNINSYVANKSRFTNSKKNYDAIFVSRVEKGKGLEDLLAAVPKIINSYPTFSLAIAGSGSNLQLCVKLAKDLNIQENIIWLGYLNYEELSQALIHSKIFVFPSHFPEGMPMAMINAMVHELPILTTKTRFAVSYLKEKENVIFVDYNDPEEFVKKISYLLENKFLYEQMIRNNIYFLNGFSQENVGKEFSSIYRNMTITKRITEPLR